MAIIIEYPQAGLKNSLELARAVDELGGRCTTEMAAEKVGMKMGGGYKTLVGSAAKYGLLTSKGGYLETSAIFKDHKLAYSSEEAEKVLQKCLLQPPVFQRLYERFKGRALPLGHFEKLLIREFGVAEAAGSRVAKYFVDGLKMCGLLGDGNVLLEIGSDLDEVQVDENESFFSSEEKHISEGQSETKFQPMENTKPSHHGYTIRISGPGMDSVMAIHEVDDLDIVEVMLRKVRRQLSAAIVGGEE
ncbi:hypothetical protein N619_17105 [Ectopseudomonas oleovorans]|nr:hypothetical protein N619_17105 [Pseudomonas oleovorans]